MIRQTNVQRQESHQCEPFVNERSTADALYSMLFADLGFGGRITAISPSRVSTHTYLALTRTTDITVYEGTVEEMRPFVLVARAYQAAYAVGRDHAVAAAGAELRTMQNGGLPIIVANLGPMLVGKQLVAQAMLIAFHEFGVANPVILGQIAALRLEDQCAVFVMAHEHPKVPVADLITLAAHAQAA